MKGGEAADGLGQRLELIVAEHEGFKGGEVADGLGQRLELIAIESRNRRAARRPMASGSAWS